MRRAVLFLAWFSALFGLCHALQIAVMVVPDALQPTMTFAWAVSSAIYGAVLTSISTPDALKGDAK
ncbi:hypothetical protein D3C72_1614790 [compost metagenome]